MRKLRAFICINIKIFPHPLNKQQQAPPRDRIIPNNQKPSEPVELSLKEAEKLRVKAPRKLQTTIKNKKIPRKSNQRVTQTMLG